MHDPWNYQHTTTAQHEGPVFKKLYTIMCLYIYAYFCAENLSVSFLSQGHKITFVIIGQKLYTR